jgi:tetratricopeptide (TPR) repeat protein
MMRVAFALLADHAVANDKDGKLYVTGGGIRALAFPIFPASQPRLALAVGFELPAPEVGKPHTMLLEATGPTKEQIAKPVAVTFTVPRDESGADKEGYFHFVYNMEDLTFPVEGAYSFAVVIDGETLERVPLIVAKKGVLPAELELAARISEGYQAYLSGDSGRAEEIFRDVVARAPDSGSGHNNLGFVLLEKGDAQSAKAEFEKAQELGYGNPEFSAANIACALYVLGDAAGALEGFRRCLNSQLFGTQGILFGIGEEGLFLVPLRSASDYVSLITLNAGWSAFRATDLAAAARYRKSASVAELTAQSDSTGEGFVDSVNALGKLLEPSR